MDGCDVSSESIVKMAGGSIKFLQFVQKCHQTFGIYPCQLSQKQHPIDSAKIIFLISLGQFMSTTVAFLVFEAKSMFDYGFAFYAIISVISCTAIYLILIWQSQDTLKFFENCERFIEKRAHSKAAYNGLMAKIELFNELLCFGFSLSMAIILLGVIPYTFVRYFIYDMGENSFYLFAPTWFPFNWKTPFGYLVAWLGQSAGALSIASIAGHFLNFVLGSCWLFIVIAEDITQDVVAFNIATKTTKSNKTHMELRTHFSDMVQIYTDAKQCVMEFNLIMQYSLFVFFSYDMLGVSSMLVTIQFELWADDSSSLEIAFLILVMSWMTLFIFLLCEPGARMTNQLELFNDEFNRCDWYLLSIELQRWYIIFLLDTQNPINLSSYANIACERNTAKEMINAAFSYFMTFRRFKS